jgi:hypothetical protein
MWFVWIVLPFVALFSAVSCAPRPASLVASQLARGQIIYQQGCATQACHGLEGEGIRGGAGFRAWPLVGEQFQRRNPTAQVVFDVVRSGGEASLRLLTDQQIYDAVAYELSLNGVRFSEVIDSQNAPHISSGEFAGLPGTGSLFPPPGNASLVTGWDAPALPVSAENSDLRLRLTQIARAESIAQASPSAAVSYLIVVVTFEDLAGRPLDVEPQHLGLLAQDGQVLAPLEIGLDYPVARFYPQTIQPGHGTAITAIFALPGTAKMGSLSYTLPSGQRLVLELGH